MDVSGISSLVTGLRATKALANAALGLATDTVLADKLNKLVHQVSDAQGALLETQSQLGALLQENHDLEIRLREAEEELRERERRQARLDEYELCEVAPQAFLYRYRMSNNPGGPEHYACPNCFLDGHVRILQVSLYAKNFQLNCNCCKNTFLGPPNPEYKPPGRRPPARNSYI
jgi:hypothetical protein